MPGDAIAPNAGRGLHCAYTGVGGEGYEHKTVNNKVHFVDPTTKATTNHIERMWKEAKQKK